MAMYFNTSPTRTISANLFDGVHLHVFTDKLVETVHVEEV